LLGASRVQAILVLTVPKERASDNYSGLPRLSFFFFLIEISGAKGTELEVYRILNFKVNRNEGNTSPPYLQVESVALSVALHEDVEQGLFQCP